MSDELRWTDASVHQLSPTNPFRVTKATDMSDQEVYDTFVASSGVLERISPVQGMPVLITGGKGSGRTHLMRYWSLPVQLLRHKSRQRSDSPFAQDGYIGQYILLGGLDASRFSVSRLPEDAISIAFGFYFDMGVLSSVLHSLQQLSDEGLIEASETRRFARSVSQLLGLPNPKSSPLGQLLTAVTETRREIDREINNAAVEARSPRIHVGNSPGEIFFGVAEFCREHFSSLKNVVVCYLLDEMENLGPPQQKYVQTLIRERREGVTLIVGGRSHGIKTYETLAAGEVNRPGAEFQPLVLDELMRSRSRTEFREFCSEIVLRRLELANLEPLDPTTHFEDERSAPLVVVGRETRAIQELRRHLRSAHHGPTGILDRAAIEHIISAVSRPTDPLQEKAAILAFYQDWAAGRDLAEAARALGDHAQSRQRLDRLLRYFRKDLVAQLRQEEAQRQTYVGFTTLTELADGNLRNFVNIMKLVHSWCEFADEVPWGPARVSLKAQQRAVADASDWFYGDRQVVGEYGAQVRVGMDRLGELLQKMRFASKPSESSLCAFNVDLSALSNDTRQVLRAAREWGWLVERRPRRDRNEERRATTLQVNKMLAPRWDLPIGRRGVVDLRAHEVESMFGTEHRDDFRSVLNNRIARLNPPFRALSTDARLFDV